jgi:TRAP-type C4-dicarboxylate transport system substrate-binding protein
MYTFKIDGITKFHIDEPMYVATFATIINSDKYAALSDDQKKIIDAHCTTEWAGKTAADWAKVEDDGRQKMRAAGSGHTMVKLKPEELAAWRKSAEPVMAKWMEDMKAAGYDGQKTLTEFKAALKKHNALAD